MTACFELKGDNLYLQLWVQPGASATALAGFHQQRLKVRLAATAEGGKANLALRTFLARLFQVRSADVTLLKGATARKKTVLIKQPKHFPAELLSAP